MQLASTSLERRRTSNRDPTIGDPEVDMQDTRMVVRHRKWQSVLSLGIVAEEI